MKEDKNSILRTRDCSVPEIKGLAGSGRLYAILDACNIPLAPKKVIELGEQRAVSLYRGTAEEEFWDVAPYLVQVDSAVLNWLETSADKEGWGIFVASPAGIENLRQHFRHYLKVRSPKAKTWLFRFYDPRVLKLFLPACTPEELRSFYGPVVALGVAPPKIEKATFYQEASVKGLANYSFMFRMREQHLEALELQGDLAFAEEVIEFLQKMHAEFVQDLPPAELSSRVLFGLTKAKRYGFRRQSSLAGFVAIMFRIGPNFDEHPAIREVLTDQAVPPDLRISDLWSRTSESDWDEAVASSQKGTWG
jgi:hypothetical protein